MLQTYYGLYCLLMTHNNVYYSGKNTSDVNNVLNQEMDKLDY